MVNLLKSSDLTSIGSSNSLLFKFIKNWYLFAVSILFCMAAIYIYAYLVEPKYKISSTLLIQDDKNGSAIGQSTAFSDLNMFQTIKTVDNEIEILRSRDLLFQTLSELPVQVSYFEKSKFKVSELYGENLPIIITPIKLNKTAYVKSLSISYLDESNYIIKDSTSTKNYRFGDAVVNKDYSIVVKKGPAFIKNFYTLNFKFNNLNSLAEVYSLAKLSILPIVKDANTITLSLIDNVPQRGIDILTKLIDNYNKQNVTNKNTIAHNTIKFIDNRLKNLISDLTGAEHDVENYKQQNGVTDLNFDAQLNVAKSNEYNQMLENAEVQLSMVSTIERYFKNNNNQNNMAPSALGLRDPILNSLISKFNDLQLEKNKILRTANAENPLVLNLNDQLSSLRINILDNLRNIKQGFVIERNNLSSNHSQFNSKVKSSPVIERGLLERSREQSVKSSLYKYLLQKREETALSLSATVPSSQIVDRPAYNSMPESPKTQLLYMCSFIIGLIIPAGFIYTKSALNNKVQDVNMIESIGAKMLGELSHNVDKNPIVFQKDNRSTISELFRYIRMNLGFMSGDNENKVMLITSGMKGEGKTFFSLNLATTLAMLDKKVIVLEFDLRKPDLLNKIGLNHSIGLSEYLSGDSVSFQDIVRPTKISSNLFVIGCGKIPEHPAELMMSHKMDELFAKLKAQYDYIILDTSPVGQVADAFSLASYADSSIYLVRYNYTHKIQLGILKDICDNRKLKNPMVVFNDAKRIKGEIYSYAGYGYTMAD